MKVEVEIEEKGIEEGGRTGPGVVASCSRCHHQAQSFGVGEGSRRRCLMLLKEDCPNGERNFYVDAEDPGESRR